MSEETLEQKVIAAINQIRPSLQNDGGDIEFIKMENNTVYVKLVGACAGCPMSQMTLKNGVQRYLQHVIGPEIIVENATQMAM
ncbi:MAG: NifU family protein [Sphaerochaetaceae bacterium]|nr:NifU family protein [Sphaerochaetaceae bacterium]